MPRGLRVACLPYVLELGKTIGAVVLILGGVLPFLVNCSTSDIASLISAFEPKELILLIQQVYGGTASKDVAHHQGTEAVQMALTVQAGTVADGTKVEVTWYPPAAASGFSFPDQQPENPQMPPPFHFTGVSVGSVVTLEYQLARAPGGTAVDTVEVTCPSGGIYATSFSHDGGRSAAGSSGVQRAMDTEDSWWKLGYYVYLTGEGKDFTRDDWDELAPFFQSGTVFVGLRFPVPANAAERGYDLPAVMRGNEHPRLSLVDHSRNPSEVAEFPMEYVPSRQEFLEEHLPARSGWHWMALAPKQTPVVPVPENLPLSAGNWELVNEMALELNELPDNGEDRILEAYICYEGTEAPPGFDTVFHTASLLTGKSAESFQGEGVTCAGPIAVRLADAMGSSGSLPDPPFSISEVPAEHVIPPGRVQMMYLIENHSDNGVTIDVHLDSERGLEWKAFRGSFTEPDFSKPLGDEITLASGELMEAWLVVDIPAGTESGIETVTCTLADATDPSKTVWQTGTVWIGDWVAPPTSSGSISWIPVGVHNSGAHGSRWRTDLGLLNGSSSAADVTITVYGTDGEHTLTRSLAAGEQVILADVVGQIPYTGAGAVKVESPEAVVVTSRSYSQLADDVECFPGGTLGQFLDSSGNLLVVGAGQVAWIPQLVENDRFRTNIALTNVGSSKAQAKVTLYDGTGAELTSYDVTLMPGQFKQENRPFAARAGVSDLEAGYAKVRVSQGSVIGYASVIDNTTNDPTTLPLVPDATEKIVWIPVGVHNSGAHGSRWRTDLGLLNGSSSVADVTITVYGTDGEHTLTRSLAAGEQVILADVVGQIPYTGAGAVKVESTEAVVVTSRSYSQLADDVQCFPGGTLGQFLDSSGNLLVVGAGQAAWIPQLVENDRFRTNIALTNVASSEARAMVTLYDGAGVVLGSYDVVLGPGQFKQANRPFAGVGGVTDLEAGYAKVEVSQGSVIGYASVIDNATNDPTTLPLVQ